MDNTILPVANSRRSRVSNKESQTIVNGGYQEVYTDMNSTRVHSESNNNGNKEVLNKFLTNEKIISSVADNMSTVLDIAKEIVRIKGSRIETQNTLDIMDKEIDKLQAATDDYVRRVSEDIKTLANRAEVTLELMNNLTNSLKENNMSDDIKALLINAVSSSIDKVWEK
ncbi:hypothetical protein [Clostridium manihotivorum]|uniref:Uncharacterized protein n=1 Tax=Clostridium manihotivorum TaxID=2320868 RepID=A0A410DQF3_9CLOT|nr:hypothetical protein [Clostridium manihotivorum]QAA31324.1 hypothetical protein C1I91_06525 [Clostridium manihotivorum]